MLEHFDYPMDDPISIEFILDRLGGMFDRFGGYVRSIGEYARLPKARFAIDWVGCSIGLGV